MILSVFTLLLAFSIAMLVLGYWSDDQIVQTIGFIFLILCSLILTGFFGLTGIEYQTGTNTTTEYHYEDLPTGDLLNTTTMNETYTMATYSNSIYGTMLLFSAVFGMILSLMDIRRRAIQ